MTQHKDASRVYAVNLPGDFAALYQDNFRFAAFAARRLGASESEAEDFSQEAFMRLLKSGGSFTAKAARAYLALAVKTMIIDRSRSCSTRMTVSIDDPKRQGEGETISPESGALGQNTPDAAHDLRIAAVSDAIGKIKDEEDRWFLTWFYRDGLSTGEIAARSGQALSSVTSKLSRLRVRYREFFIEAVTRPRIVLPASCSVSRGELGFE